MSSDHVQEIQSNPILSPQASGLPWPSQAGLLPQLYEAILDASTDVILLVAADYRVLYANRAALRAFGDMTGRTLHREDIVGRPVHEVGFPEALLASMQTEFQQAAMGTPAGGEAMFPTADGHSYPYGYELTPVQGTEPPFSVICVAWSLDDHPGLSEDGKRSLLSERRARVEAETAVHVRDDFLSIAAHDLKTPLTAAQGRAQLLLRQISRGGEPNIERITTHVTALQAAITQMATQIAELQDVAFIQIGRPLELRQELGDLAEEIRRAVSRMPRVEGSTVTADVSFAQEPLRANFDRVRIGRVLDNLLSNAIKYSGQRKIVTIHGRLDETTEHPRIRIDVADNGIGIPAVDLPRIFGRFQRAGNVGLVTGVGIGLAGARQIINQHGGAISVTSVEGEGTTISLWLPAATDR